jgi:hypothetical protein
VRLGGETTQITTQIITPLLASIEGRNGPTLSGFAHAHTTHFDSRLLDMLLYHPTVTFSQPTQQNEQQLIIAQRPSTAHALTQMRPALQCQTPIQRLSQ